MSYVELTDPEATFEGHFDDFGGESAEFTLNGKHIATAYTHEQLGGDVTIEIMPGGLSMTAEDGTPFFAPGEVLPALRNAFC